MKGNKNFKENHNDINGNCLLVKNFGHPLFRYCQFCRLKFVECPIFQFIVVSLILVVSLLSLSYFSEKKIPFSLIIIIFLVILLYYFFYNKILQKNTEIQFTKKKIEEELEEAKAVLEIKVRARTRELRELAEKLDEKVKERTSQLEKEKDKTLAIITNFTDGILVLDKENKISLINPAIENFFQVKTEDTIGKSIFELGSFKLLGEFLKGAEMVYRKEVPIRENLIVEVSIVPIMSKGERVGTLFILHDITREKLIERMKTEFVSLSAHQLRTPLSAIKWSLKMILDGDLGKITKEQKSFLQKTFEANERMIELINDLLDVTRIEEGRYLYRLEFADIERIIDRVVDPLKKVAENKKIDLKFKRPKEKLPKVKVDVEKISSAIQNLIENAITYTPSGGKVTVSIKRVKNKLEISVADTGIGIPKDQQKKVFTKFFRGANAIKMETKGTGLGLYITKNIIEAHGGQIWFESEEKKGTKFYFTLPI